MAYAKTIIFVVFSRGGYKVIRELGRPDCLILHDVDLVPLHPSTPYTCADTPVHM